MLWLFAFFLTRTILLSTTMGNNLYYLFPSYPELKGVEYPILSSISVIFYYLFIESLFRLRKTLFSAYKFIKIISALLVVYMPLSLLLGNVAHVAVGALMHFVVTLSVAVIGWLLYKRNVRLSLAITIISIIQLFIGILYFFSYQYYWFEQVHLLMFAGFWLHNILVIFLLSRQYRHQMQVVICLTTFQHRLFSIYSALKIVCKTCTLCCKKKWLIAWLRLLTRKPLVDYLS